MTTIADSRSTGQGDAVVNRKRFLEKAKQQIGDAVRKSIAGRKITDIDKGEEIHISPHDIDEPTIGHGPGGRRTTIHPGNRDFLEGDEVDRPQKGGAGGSGGGQASNSGEGEDDFVFNLTKEEFFEFFFEDMALPNLVKKSLTDVNEWIRRRAGYSSSGVPVQLDLLQTMRRAKGRKMALSAKKRRELAQLLLELQALLETPGVNQEDPRVLDLRLKISRVQAKIRNVRFLEEVDQIYRQYKLHPVPSTSAVMFCIMDVSGSMTQAHKDLAKRFFVLLYMFLSRNYEKIEIVYIRHHTTAKEVDHDEFFFSRDTGGTVVSTALELALQIIKERYSQNWNLYVAQASDGDNWHNDSPKCKDILLKELMPLLGYFAYVELMADNPQSLWKEYEEVKKQHPRTMGIQRIHTAADVYPVLHELFQKESAKAD